MRPDILAYTKQFIQKNTGEQSKLGKLIILEGCDGTGKTTTAKTLAKLYDGIALSSPIEGTIRAKRAEIDKLAFEDPLNRFKFFRDANVIDSKKHLIPRLQVGQNIFLDRYILSTIVGNMGLGLDLPAEELQRIPDIVIPDATFFLSLNEKARNQRVLRRAETTGGMVTDNAIDKASDVQAKVASMLDELIEYGLIKIDITGLKPEDIAKIIIGRLKIINIILESRKNIIDLDGNQ